MFSFKLHCDGRKDISQLVSRNKFSYAAGLFKSLITFHIFSSNFFTSSIFLSHVTDQTSYICRTNRVKKHLYKFPVT